MKDSAKVLVLLINVWCVQEKTREPIWFNGRSQRDGRDWIEWLTDRIYIRVVLYKVLVFYFTNLNIWILKSADVNFIFY